LAGVGWVRIVREVGDQLYVTVVWAEQEVPPNGAGPVIHELPKDIVGGPWVGCDAAANLIAMVVGEAAEVTLTDETVPEREAAADFGLGVVQQTVEHVNVYQASGRLTAHFPVGVVHQLQDQHGRQARMDSNLPH
jgi:hypothetical protein